MTEIASHRGGAALWPENSPVSFRETCQLGVEQIEFDVQLSADGVPVIFHDATLDRVTNGTGPVGAHTLSALKKLEIFRGGGKIMTLEEGLDILEPSPLILRCEIKPAGDLVPYPGLVARTLDIFAARGLLERTVITSFLLSILREVGDRQPSLADMIWLVADELLQMTSPEHVARLACEEGIRSVAPRWTLLRDGALGLFRNAGLEVGAFAVLEDEAIEWALRNELSVFTTDRPDAALRIRERLKSES